MSDNNNWKDKLSQKEYHVARCGGTEPPFTGKYYKYDEEGTYNVGSGAVAFDDVSDGWYAQAVYKF